MSKNEVFLDPATRTGEQAGWRVWFNDLLMPPSFNSKGAAQAYLNKLVNQQRVADRVDGYDRDDLGESPDY